MNDSERRKLYRVPQERDKEEDLCIVCLDDVKSTIYKPCGHRV